MRNPYKRTDVFRCRHESHARFGYRVSAYHVLRAKKCYPNGCVVYKWFCHRFAKGKPCVRGFSHVGRLCVGCTHYRDTRVHYQPEVVLSDSDFREFLDEVEEFEDWLAEHRYRRVDALGTVTLIRPLLRKIVEKNGARIVLAGYLVRLDEAFLGVTGLEDPVYLQVSAHQQRRYGFRIGDRVEFQAHVGLDRGRLLLRELSRVEFVERGEPASARWDEDVAAVVARLVATRIPDDAERCLSCPRAVLVDVEFHGEPARGRRRELFCLEGVQDHLSCILPVLDRLGDEWLGFEVCDEGEVMR